MIKIITMLFVLLGSYSMQVFSNDVACTGSISVYTNGCTFSSNGFLGRAQLYKTNASVNLENLIVYVAGFDIGGESSPENVYEDNTGLFRRLAEERNDILVISFGEFSTQSIQGSASALQVVFSHLNKMKKNGLNRSTIIGHSMGGLVSRYALLKSEDLGEDHGMSTYVSLDSPHLGAQSPIGLQYLTFATRNQLSDLYNDLSESGLIEKVASDELAALESAGGLLDDTYARMLDNESTKQMMIYNILDPQQLKKNQLHAELAAMGDMPSKTKNIGISNGTLNTLNAISTNIGQVSLVDSVANTLVEVNVDEELVDNIAEFTGLYSSKSSNILGHSVASVSTALPVKVEVKGKYFKCTKKKKYGVTYPSCGWRYGVIASYTEVDHDFYINYPSPVSFDADSWPGSTASVYPEVIAPLMDIMSDLGFANDATFVNSNSTFLPTQSALAIKSFDPFDQTGFSLQPINHEYVSSNSLFDQVVYSRSTNLEHGDHDLLFDDSIRSQVLHNSDDYWLIPVIAGLIL